MNEYKVYTKPMCPKCKILKTKLQSKHLTFDEVSSEEEMLKLGICEVPVLQTTDGKLLNFHDANEFINSLEVELK